MNETANLFISPAPHVTKGHNTTRIIMLHVLIALLPVTVAAVFFFGYMVIVNVFFCVLFCMGLELLYNVAYKKKWNREGLLDNSAWDFSPAVTGTILALNLPTHLDIWGLNITSGSKVVLSFDTIIACFIASVVAIVLVKMLFGGIGKNFANPAVVGRIFLFVAFAAAFNGLYAPSGEIAATTGATWLGNRQLAVPLLDMFLGNTGAAAVGETCALAIIIGYAYLSVTKVIDFRIPLIVVVSTVAFALLFDGILKYTIGNSLLADGATKAASPLNSAKDWAVFAGRHALSGGLLFGAVFMCTDYSSTPNNFWGRVVFATGVGLFTAVMRTWAMPEGISFAILIMNIITPLINKVVRPKFFGAERERKQPSASGTFGGAK